MEDGRRRLPSFPNLEPGVKEKLHRHRHRPSSSDIQDLSPVQTGLT
jgi:hypothetical protein